MIAAISQLIKGAEIAAPGADAFDIRRALPHGHVAAVLGTMRKTGIDALLNGMRPVSGALRFRPIGLRYVANYGISDVTKATDGEDGDLEGRERRRKWLDEQKLQILEEVAASGFSVSEIAPST